MFAKHKVWHIGFGLALASARAIALAFALAFALAACSAAPTAAPTLAPTIDTKPTFDAISTQAAQTVVANLTLTAPSATPIVPTNTVAPTNTVPPAPTDTPAPTSTPTRVFIPWTQTPTPTQAAYACAITGVSPASTDKITVNQDFDGKWTLKNTGTKTWVSSNVDIRYIDGEKFQKKTDVVDLGSDVAPNGTYTVVVDMVAPSNDGTHSTRWGLTLEDGSICYLSLTINVSK